MSKRPTAVELLAFIAEGRTVTIYNSLKAWSISPKTAAAWARSGRPVLKDGPKGELLLARGKTYDDCSYCAIRVA
jgi:hypothetical protein